MRQIEVLANFSPVSRDAIVCAKDGWTPVFDAASKGHIKMAKELIEAGLDINHKSKVRVIDMR